MKYQHIVNNNSGLIQILLVIAHMEPFRDRLNGATL